MLLPNYKYPVAQQKPGSLSRRSSLRCFQKLVGEQTGSSTADFVNKLQLAGWLRLFVELFCCIWGIMCSLITLVPPKSKPLTGMKWMAEWIDVHPFPPCSHPCNLQKNRMGRQYNVCQWATSKKHQNNPSPPGSELCLS